MIEQDIHQGLEDTNNTYTNENNTPIVFSIGHRCTSTSLIQMMNKKFESYPFDWVVSKLNVVADCIETNFKDFLSKDNYTEETTETFNLLYGEKTHICYDKAIFNYYYENKMKENNSDYVNPKGTYGLQLSMTHHDIRQQKDYEYFQRCIARFHKILSLPNKKYYLYTHPIMDMNQYIDDMEDLQSYFHAFIDYFKTKTTNSFGIFLFVVKREDKKGQIELISKSNDYAIYTLYTNNGLIDAGAVFSGDFYTEQHNLLLLLESIIV